VTVCQGYRTKDITCRGSKTVGAQKVWRTWCEATVPEVISLEVAPVGWCYGEFKGGQSCSIVESNPHIHQSTYIYMKMYTVRVVANIFTQEFPAIHTRYTNDKGKQKGNEMYRQRRFILSILVPHHTLLFLLLHNSCIDRFVGGIGGSLVPPWVTSTTTNMNKD
jgi:hypothetical protein